jgi:transposase InsO family protein
MPRDRDESQAGDFGPEFVAKAIRQRLAELGVKTLFIEPGSPGENGYIESFTSKLRDELSKRRDLLHLKGGTDPRGRLAAARQRPAAPQLAGATPAGT